MFFSQVKEKIQEKRHLPHHTHKVLGSLEEVQGLGQASEIWMLHRALQQKKKVDK